jgi:hypothetical protein
VPISELEIGSAARKRLAHEEDTGSVGPIVLLQTTPMYTAVVDELRTGKLWTS